jgi:hypothetical protein
MVAVTMSGPYEFEVFDGSRSISAPARTHQLQAQPNGKVLRVVNGELFLNSSVRVDGGEDRSFAYSAPALGTLDIRSSRGNCKILIGSRDMGYPPLKALAVVAGEYEISLDCPDGQNPKERWTVLPGRTQRVTFTAK